MNISHTCKSGNSFDVDLPENVKGGDVSLPIVQWEHDPSSSDISECESLVLSALSSKADPTASIVLASVKIGWD